MNAAGEVILNLNALEANSAASGDSTGVLNVKTVDGTERGRDRSRVPGPNDRHVRSARIRS